MYFTLEIEHINFWTSKNVWISKQFLGVHKFSDFRKCFNFQIVCASKTFWTSEKIFGCSRKKNWMSDKKLGRPKIFVRAKILFGRPKQLFGRPKQIFVYPAFLLSCFASQHLQKRIQSSSDGTTSPLMCPAADAVPSARLPHMYCE